MNREPTRRGFAREAIAGFKGVVSLLAGFSFAGLTILMNAEKAGPLYIVAYTTVCVATVALICAAFVSSMLRSALNFEPLSQSPLRWISILLMVLGFGGIGLFLAAVVLIAFLESPTVGFITSVSVVLCGSVTLFAFWSLNRRYSALE